MAITEELQAVVREAAERFAVPGVAAGILVDGEDHVAAHGVTSVAHPLPVDEHTLFQVGSISKTFTGSLLVALEAEGRLRLDDPIGRHLPSLGAMTGLDVDAITVEHCLSHQSGFDGDHLFVTRDPDDLRRLAGARRLFPPGEGFSYSNAGFTLAGAVAEAATGEAFTDLMRQRFLRALGRGAGYRADEVITERVAMPHWVVDGTAHLLRRAGWQPGWQLMAGDAAPGGLIASVAHLLAWSRAQITGAAPDGTVLLPPEARHRLHTPVVECDRRDAVALDWHVRDVDGARTIGHGGTTVGYVSDLLVVPDREAAVVVLTNAVNGSAVHRVVRRWALERAVGLTETDPVPDRSRPVDAGRVEGRYLHPFGDVTVVATPDDRIELHSSTRSDLEPGWWQPPLPPPTPAAFVDADHAVLQRGEGPPALIRFGPSAPGEPSPWLQWSDRRAPRAP